MQQKKLKTTGLVLMSLGLAAISTAKILAFATNQQRSNILGVTTLAQALPGTGTSFLTSGTAGQASILSPLFQVNIPAVFTDTATLLSLIVEEESVFNGQARFLDEVILENGAQLLGNLDADGIDIDVVAGEITASNLVYSVLAGSGITVSGDQDITITNSDRGSAQKMFGKVKVGSDTAEAGSNTDTFEFASGDGISLSLNTSDKKMTITGSNQSGWYKASSSNVVLLSSTDSVGIGTSTPTNKLEVDSGTDGASGVSFTRITSSTAAGIGGGKVLSVDSGGRIILVQDQTGESATPSAEAVLPTATSGMTLYFNGTNWAASNNLFHDGGSVGISTTSPTSRFQVNTNLASKIGAIIQGYTSQTANLQEWRDSSGSILSYIDASGVFNGSANVSGALNPGLTSGSVLFQGASGIAQDNTNFFWNDTSNYLGIGTSSPGRVLDIVAPASSAFRITRNTSASMFVELRTGDFGAGNGALIYAPSLAYTSNGTSPLVTFTGSGTVGIGTTAPLEQLHVTASGGDSAYFEGDVKIGLDGASPGGNPAGYLHITSNWGDDVKPAIHIGSGTYGWNQYYTTSGDLTLNREISSVESNVLTMLRASGNVGIGTTSPSSALEVGSGVITIPVGSMGAPSLTFAGNTTTGIYRPAINRIGFAAGGSPALILTDNTSAAFGQWGSTNYTISPGTAGSGNDNRAGTNLVLTGGQSTGDQTGGSLIFQTSPAGSAGSTANTLTTRMTILGNGNVGIGTTAPGAKLQVIPPNQTDFSFQVSSDDGVGIIKSQWRNTAIGYGAVPVGTTALLVNSAGTEASEIVRITTSKTTAKLLVLRPPPSNTANMQEWQDSNSNILSAVNASGYLGIGTSSPAVKLHVYGPTDGTGSELVRIDSSGHNYNNAIVKVLAGGTTGRAELYLRGGTTSAGYSSLFLGDSGDEDVGGITYSHGENSLRLTVNAGEKVRIDSSGNVGIGTTAPNAKFEVNGNVLIGDGGSSSNPRLTFWSGWNGTGFQSIEGLNTVYNGTSWTGNSNYGSWVVDKYSTTQPAPASDYIRWNYKSTGNLGSSGTTMMALTGQGYLGIGTTVPDGKLHVSGTTYLRNSLNSGSGVGAVITTPYDNSASVGYGGYDSPNLVLRNTAGVNNTWSQIFFSPTEDSVTPYAGISGRSTSNVNKYGYLQFHTRYGSNGSNYIITTLKDEITALAGTTQTNTSKNLLTLSHRSSGTPAAGFGSGILLQGESTTTEDQSMAGITALWTDATHATRTSGLSFATVNSGGSLTERVRIDGAGNVGIGTTSPTSQLYIYGTNTQAGGIILKSSSNDIERLAIYANGGSSSAIQKLYSGGYLNFLNSSGGTEMVLDDSGEVGIGTTTPSEKLHIYGASGASGATPVGIRIDSSTNSQAWTANSVFGKIDAFLSGDGSGGGTSEARTRIASVVEDTTATDVGLSFYTSDGDLVTKLNERMRLKSNGYLGIGTTNPIASLHVETADNTTARFSRSTNAALNISNFANYATLTGVASDNGSYKSLQFETVSGGTMYLDTAGNVGIGTTTFGTSAGKVLALAGSTAPSTSITDGVQLFAVDVTGSHELQVRDEAGNVTTLSPHNFSQIEDGKSEDLAWSFYSERNGLAINADMTKALRVVEKLSGEKLVYIKNLTNGADLSDFYADQAQTDLVTDTATWLTRAELSPLANWSTDIWTFIGKVIFEKPAEFLADVTFKARVNFADADTAGLVVMKANSTVAHVTFDKEFATKPAITLTPQNTFVRATVSDLTTKGFTVILESTQTQDIEIMWTTVSVNNLKRTESEPAANSATTTNPAVSPTIIPTPTPTPTSSTSTTPTVIPSTTPDVAGATTDATDSATQPVE